MFSERNSLYKILLLLGAVILIVILCVAMYRIYTSGKDQALVASDYKNITYVIGGQSVRLQDGFAETEINSSSASKITTRYFGNELKTDIDNNGRDDVVFLLTQQTGGTGTFYYVVVALDTYNGYKGSDGYFLGDRISPQTTGLSQNPRHKNVIVVNYADRALNEPMTAKPSIGKSVYLKLDPTTMRWGIVEPDFEGESL